MSMFISFEGGEGSGKTTIIENLYRDLSEMGFSLIKTREPGGSRIAEQIRNVILDVENTRMDYRTEALLYAASRRQHLTEVIVPALKENKIVLCDRYIDSSLAYQGYARGLGINEIYQINQYATDGIMPDLTFYIDITPEVGLKRIRISDRIMDRLDLEQCAFHEKVREGYLQVAELFKNRIAVIDGNRTIPEICGEIGGMILKKLQ